MAVLTEIFHDLPWVSSFPNVHIIHSYHYFFIFPDHFSHLILCRSSSSVEVVLPSVPHTPCYLFLFPQAIFFSLCLSFSYSYRLSSLYNELLALGAQDDMGVATFCHNTCPILQHPLRKLSFTKILQVQYCFLNLELDGSGTILFSQPWIGWFRYNTDFPTLNWMVQV